MSDVQHRTLAHAKMRSQWVMVECSSMYIIHRTVLNPQCWGIVIEGKCRKSILDLLLNINPSAFTRIKIQWQGANHKASKCE